MGDSSKNECVFRKLARFQPWLTRKQFPMECFVLKIVKLSIILESSSIARLRSLSCVLLACARYVRFVRRNQMKSISTPHFLIPQTFAGIRISLVAHVALLPLLLILRAMLRMEKRPKEVRLAGLLTLTKSFKQNPNLRSPQQ